LSIGGVTDERRGGVATCSDCGDGDWCVRTEKGMLCGPCVDRMDEALARQTARVAKLEPSAKMSGVNNVLAAAGVQGAMAFMDERDAALARVAQLEDLLKRVETDYCTSLGAFPWGNTRERVVLMNEVRDALK
jgi:hypothetical protein